MRRCPICGGDNPSKRIGAGCSPECKREMKRQKAIRKDIRARKEAIRPPSWWAGKAQDAVNAFRRYEELYRGEGCISCGTHSGQMHAGHYRSRGAIKALALEPLNIWLQCAQCNAKKGGNVVEYRIRLREKIGDKLLDWLEGPHEPTRYRKEDYQAIEAQYKAELKNLKEKNREIQND